MPEKDRRHQIRSLLLPLALAFAFGAATAASAQSSGKLNVSVAGVRNDNGSVRCGLYSSANGFREPGREMRGAVAPIKNGQATCVFNGVPAGAGVPGFAHADDPHNSLFGRTRNQSMFRELGLLPSLVGRGWGVGVRVWGET